MPLRNIFLLVLSINTVCITSAHAYIDPNTGGFFFQTVAPFVYGMLGVLVVFWKRILAFVKGIFGGKKGSGDSN